MIRWCSCRTYYKRLKKEFKNKSGANGSAANIVPEPAWTFYKSLKFLDPSFGIRSSISNSFTNIITYF